MGGVIPGTHGKIETQYAQALGKTTNNQAKISLWEGLNPSTKKNIKKNMIFVDLMVVIQQVLEAKNHLKSIHSLINLMILLQLQQFEHVEIFHVLRNLNFMVDVHQQTREEGLLKA